MATVTADIIIAAIAATMSIDRSVTRVGWQSGIAVLVAGLILVISVPQIMAYTALAYVPSSVSRGLKDGRDIPTPVLSHALLMYQKAAEALPADAVIQQDLGRLELRHLVEPMSTDLERDAALRAASGYFRASIANAPSRAFPWSLEAYVQSELAASPDEVSDLLRMSYFLGPHEPSSMLLRTRIATGAWTSLPDDMRSFAGQDIRGLWRIRSLRRSLANIYLSASLDTRIAIRQIALTNPDDQVIFDRLVKSAAKVNRR